jgi:plastocyanin
MRHELETGSMLNSSRRAFALIAVICAAALGAAASAAAADSTELSISIKDHKFDPSQLKVPAGKAIKLTVNNLDATAEEFESSALDVEKVVAGKSSAVVRLKALAKGSYPFVGEYHEETAKGVLIAE